MPLGLCLLDPGGVWDSSAAAAAPDLLECCVFSLGLGKGWRPLSLHCIVSFLIFYLLLVYARVWRSETNVWGQFHIYVNSGIGLSSSGSRSKGLPQTHVKERVGVWKVGTVCGIFQCGTVVFYYSTWC